MSIFQLWTLCSICSLRMLALSCSPAPMSVCLCMCVYVCMCRVSVHVSMYLSVSLHLCVRDENAVHTHASSLAISPSLPLTCLYSPPAVMSMAPFALSLFPYECLRWPSAAHHPGSPLPCISVVLYNNPFTTRLSHPGLLLVPRFCTGLCLWVPARPYRQERKRWFGIGGPDRDI